MKESSGEGEVSVVVSYRFTGGFFGSEGPIGFLLVTKR